MISEHELSAAVTRHRRELHLHCYRMLGSFHDAEDAVQEALLRAWRGRATYAERAPVRAWLYGIATRTCLDVLRGRRHRILPVDHGSPARGAHALPHVVDEPIWLEPYPDALLPNTVDDPHAAYSLRESVSLAFVAAVQHLAPRQRAVLLLRDVVGWTAADVAAFADLSVAAVNSALQRAREAVRTRIAPRDNESQRAQQRDASRLSDLVDASARDLIDAYVRAWEAGDLDALLALLKEDVIVSMPPDTLWFHGRDAFAAYVSTTIMVDRRPGTFRLLPAPANGQPAFAFCHRQGDVYSILGVMVLTVDGRSIGAITGFFDPRVLPYFGLEPSLPTQMPTPERLAAAPFST